MAKGNDEERASLGRRAISFMISSMCSVALPVALSFYFAPEKSLDYFQSSLKGKIDEVSSIRFDEVLPALYSAATDVLIEVPPMLETEWSVLSVIFRNVPPVLYTTVLHLSDLDYRIVGTLLLILLIVGYCFPWQDVIDWISNVLWGSICVVASFLPLDNGMEVLSDKEAGTYRMTIVFSAVIFTLAANYLCVILLWSGVKLLLSSLLSLVCGRRKDAKVKVPSTLKLTKSQSQTEVDKVEVPQEEEKKVEDGSEQPDEKEESDENDKEVEVDAEDLSEESGPVSDIEKKNV